MSNETSPKSDESDFIRKVKKDLHIYNNLNFILEKIRKEKHFSRIKEIYLNIFSSELTFTLKSRITRTAQYKKNKGQVRHQEGAGQQSLYFQGELEADYYEDR